MLYSYKFRINLISVSTLNFLVNLILLVVVSSSLITFINFTVGNTGGDKLDTWKSSWTILAIRRLIRIKRKKRRKKLKRSKVIASKTQRNSLSLSFSLLYSFYPSTRHDIPFCSARSVAFASHFPHRPPWFPFCFAWSSTLRQASLKKIKFPSLPSLGGLWLKVCRYYTMTWPEAKFTHLTVRKTGWTTRFIAFLLSLLPSLKSSSFNFDNLKRHRVFLFSSSSSSSSSFCV